MEPAEAVAERLRKNEWGNLNEAFPAAVAGSRVDWLVDLLTALTGADNWMALQVRRLAVEALALIPGSVSVLAAAVPADYFVPRGLHTDEAARQLGARLGCHQPTAALVEALALSDVPHWSDILVLWIQEAVARGADLRGEPGIVDFWSATDHELTAMPLCSVPLEAEAQQYPSSYHAMGAGGWGGTPVWWKPTRLPTVPPAPLLTSKRLTSKQRVELSAAYASAVLHSGRLEVRVFTLAAPISGLSQPVVSALRLSAYNNTRDLSEGDALEPVTAPADLQTATLTAEAALAVLMSVATEGGCTNVAWSAAWGRRDAWRTLGALAGARGSLEDIAAVAQRCQWAAFKVQTGWFYGVVDDPTLVCLRPDGRSIAVFVGTDSD